MIDKRENFISVKEILLIIHSDRRNREFTIKIEKQKLQKSHLSLFY